VLQIRTKHELIEAAIASSADPSMRHILDSGRVHNLGRFKGGWVLSIIDRRHRTRTIVGLRLTDIPSRLIVGRLTDVPYADYIGGDHPVDIGDNRATLVEPPPTVESPAEPIK